VENHKILFFVKKSFNSLKQMTKTSKNVYKEMINHADLVNVNEFFLNRNLKKKY